LQRGLSEITGTPSVGGGDEENNTMSGVVSLPKNLPPILSNKELFKSPMSGKVPLHTIQTTGVSSEDKSSMNNGISTRY
jgi:hypothetical protein